MKIIYSSLRGEFVGVLKVMVMFLVLVGMGVKGWGQVNISSQDFETVPATPTLTFANTNGANSTGTNPAAGVPANANLFVSEARGWQANNTTSTITFANQSLAGYTNCFVDFRIAGMSINGGNGIDGADIATISISVDGGTTYSSELTIAGSAANQRWDFTATGSTSLTYDGNNTPTAVTSSTGSGATSISTGTINIPNANTQVRVRIVLLNNDANERWVIDDVRIRGTASGCVPTTTVTGFVPATGPVGTRVTITGSGYSATSGVRFGTVDVTTVVFINSTTIIATVPVGVSSTSTVSVSNAAACFSSAFGSFTLINTTSTCVTPLTDLIISEVNDPLTGNNHNIEIYNGTLNTINLNTTNYQIQILNDPSTTTNIDITGTIAPGEVKVYYAGANGGYSGTALGTQASAGVGFNDNDQVRLLKAGTIIDRVNCPNEEGFNFRRNGTVTGPNATYTASEWIFSSTESTADLGLFTVAIPSSLDVTTQPIDQTCTFSMSIVASGSPTAYQWKYFNTTTNTWVNVTSAAFPNATIPVSGVGSPTSTTLNISGDISDYYDYQFYCEIRNTVPCTKASNAAQFKYNTRLIYRSLATGSYTNPANWEMSDALGGPWVSACTYPIAANSQEIYITNGTTITIDNATNISIPIDKCTIDAGGQLSIGTTGITNNDLTVLNSQAGADIIVNGTLIDRGSTGNGLNLTTSAGWIIGNAGTLIKTNTSSVASYRDNYEGGIAAIPATANWIYRYNGDGNVAVVSVDMFYPNLTYESTVVGNRDASGVGEKFIGSSGYTTVKGNLDIGGTGAGTVNVYNENTNSQSMLVNGNLAIGTGSTLNNGAATSGTGFEVKGNVTVNGRFIVNANSLGTLTLSGTAVQTIAGSNLIPNNMDIQNCVMSNTVGITENKDFNIFGTHTFTNNARLNFGTGNITLKSTSTMGTANVAAIPATALLSYVGSGSFIVERYLFGRRAWRLLAAPIQTTNSPSILNSWQEAGSFTSTGYGTQISGPAGGTGLDYTTQRGSLKWFDESIQNYLEITNTNAAIARSEGYYVFVRGDRAQGLSGTGLATNLRIKGRIHTGTQPNITVGATNFVTFGNPYPSAIDFRNVNKTNIVDAFIAWNPNSAGSYNVGAFETYTLNVAGTHYERTPGGIIRDSIQSGEAVFIQSITGGSITIEENDKVGGSRNVSRENHTISRDGVTDPTLEINLYTNDNNSNSFLADGIKLNFSNSYSNTIDNYDVRKITNTADNLFIAKSGYKLVVERRSNLTANDTIFLNLTNTRIAAYTFIIDPSVLSNTGLNAFLKDKYLLTETAVSLTSVTNVLFNITTDAASRVADRFMIVFRAAGGPLPVTFVDIAAAKNADKTNSVKWNVANELNIQQYEIERSDRGTSFINIGNTIAQNNTGGNYSYNFVDVAPLSADNYYRIKSTSVNGAVQYSTIVKVSADVKVPSIAVYPNPVEDKLIKIHFTGNPSKYAVSLLTAAGKTVYTKNITVISESETQTIEVNKSFTAGNYSLVLVAEDGSKKVIPIVIL